ncbi:helix-turn-helix domain-containing protein [Haladaptatus sp. DYF46]|uniref:helix-turn-helix domain-containing protein n=1 Tax=Haladaptatus sp. DYF46 TaxID=2886041 RepID=UPI001E442024|nr:helix-turn-helix domain-containing protein [Haladaptatus sp. DYF46]
MYYGGMLLGDERKHVQRHADKDGRRKHRYMPSAQIKFEFSNGPGALSTKRPDDEFRILAALPTADGIQVVLEIQTSDTEALIRHLDEASWLPSYDVLHADEQTMLIQYSHELLPALHRALLSSGPLLQYPLTLRNGWMSSDLTTSHEQLSQLKDVFEAEGIPYEIGSVTQSTDPTDLLTDRQRRFITVAVEHGYYDSPRECTLTELAAALDVSKGGASGILHRAEGRIIKNFLGEPAA